MAMYKCKNFESCSRAGSGEEFSLAAGTDDKCPECGSTLVRVGKEAADSGSGGITGNWKLTLISSAAGVLFLVLATAVYMKWDSSRVVVLKPDSSPTVKAFVPISATTSSVSTVPAMAGVALEPPPIEKPSPMVANEVAARKTCDEAVKAKQRDADKVCRRASAITLMNSGVLAAVAGKLDEAEKDYLAAKEKDADFPELYFNLAILKARQNKGSEAIDYLTLADTKGFSHFSVIKKEPAFQKLKSDPLFKKNIEGFEAK